MQESSATCLAIKRCQRTKSGKVIKLAWSLLKSWAHNCARRGIAVKSLGIGIYVFPLPFPCFLLWEDNQGRVFPRGAVPHKANEPSLEVLHHFTEHNKLHWRVDHHCKCAAWLDKEVCLEILEGIPPLLGIACFLLVACDFILPFVRMLCVCIEETWVQCRQHCAMRLPTAARVLPP